MAEINASDLMVYRQIGEMLKLRRKDLGLRQADISTRLHMPQSAISKVETGERRIELVEAVRICEAYEMELNAVLAVARTATR